LDLRSLFEKSDGKTFKMLRSCRGELFDKSKFEIINPKKIKSKNAKSLDFWLILYYYINNKVLVAQ
jgi:hypothetical protein